MSLALLPTELLHQVASYITSLDALRALARVNRRFHAIFDPLLYQQDARLHPSAAIDWAAEHGRLDIIHKALSHGAGLPKTVRGHKFGPRRKNLSKNPRAHPLCVAVQNGHAEIVDFFIASGCDINMTGNLWVSLLSLAVIHGHPHLLTLLLSLGATHDKHSSRARSPIEHAASQGDMVAMEILLSTKRPNWPFFRHTQNAFECAFNKGDSHMMQLILDSGRLDINFRFSRPPDQQSYTPLLWAVESEDIEHIKLFLNAGADPNFPATEWRVEREPALVRAVRRKRADMVRLLLPKTDRPRRTLALACSIKCWASDADTHIPRILLESGTRPDFEEGDRTNLGAPLSHAPPGPIDDDPAVSPLILAIFRGQIDLVRLLVAHGADLLVDFLGPVEADPEWTIGAPLLLAVRLGHEEIAEFLRDQGASEASRMMTRFDDWSKLYS